MTVWVIVRDLIGKLDLLLSGRYRDLADGNLSFAAAR